MGLDRLVAHHESLGDLAVRQTLGHQPQHLGLARGELGQRVGAGGCRRSQARELAHETARHGGREQRVAGCDDAHGVEERLRPHVLEQETARPGAESVVDVLVEIERREDDHSRCAFAVSGHAPRRLDAVHDRHAHVHQHHVRASLATDLHRLLAVRGGSHDAEVRLGAEERREPGADDLLVVDDDDTDRHPAAPGIGSSASTAKPPPSAGPTVSVPPTMIARSRMPRRPCPSGSGATVPGP